MRLKSYTEDPLAIAGYGLLEGEDGRAFVLGALHPAPGNAPDMLIAAVEGVTTREAAEALNRVRLGVPRERLDASPEEDEFLLADLIGLAVRDRDGTALGTIVAVPNYGAGDLLEIAPQDPGPTALLPFTKTFVPEVDLAARQVVIDPPDGLFATGPDGPGTDPVGPAVGRAGDGPTAE